jgi:hypothetical protein
MNPGTSKSSKAGTDPKTPPAAAEVADQVGREILESRLDPGVWATALSQCDGRRQEAMALYTRLRIRQLTKLHRLQRVKNRSFETRRIAKCMGDNETRASLAKTIQEMLHETRAGKSQNFVRPKVSVVWLTILFIGTSGTVASLGRLFAAEFPEAFAHPLTLVALLSGVGTVWCALVLRYFLPKRWIMLGWNTGLVVACNVVCLSSLFLGTKVIKRAIAADRVVIPFRQASVVPVTNGASAKPASSGSSYMVSAETAEPPAGN